MPEPPPDYLARNQAAWDAQAPDYEADGRASWESEEPVWGLFRVPESQVGFLPDDVAGLDAIELGCGTGYVSAWLARRGARPVGIDASERQLATAKRFQAEFGVEFPLLHGNAERVPYPGGSFDLAVSEYGASIWCDPYAWIPEAARLLKPGGRLVFLVNTPLVIACQPELEAEPVGERLVRPWFGMHRIEWPDDDSVEFHLPHGKLIDLLRSCELEVEGLVEIQPPADATTRFHWMPLEWARRWPCEEVWKARKADSAD
jgi:SAM-dependent methyltransferase